MNVPKSESRVLLQRGWSAPPKIRFILLYFINHKQKLVLACEFYSINIRATFRRKPLWYLEVAWVLRYKTNLLVLKVHFAFNLLENFKLSKKILLYNSDFKKNHYGFQNKLQKQKKQKIYSIWFVQCTFKLKLTLSQTESHIIYLT